MNETEIHNLLTLAVGAFPSMQDKNMDITAKVWAKVLNDIPYKVAEEALVRTLSKAKTFPSLAEIREAVVINAQTRPLTKAEAYEEVLRAISRYGGRKEREAVESLSPLTRQAVKSVGWYSLCYSKKIHNVRLQFGKEYEELLKREAIEARVPHNKRLYPIMI